MRRALLVVALFAATLAGAAGIRKQIGQSIREPIGTGAVGFAPSTVYARELADVVTLSAPYATLRGDGTAAGSQADYVLAKQGTVATTTSGAGTAADPIRTSQTFTGNASNYYRTPSTGLPLTDFYVCAIAKQSVANGTNRMMAAQDVSGSRIFTFNTTTALNFAVFDAASDLSFFVEGTADTAWHMYCATYNYTSDGASEARGYIDGTPTGALKTNWNGPPAPVEGLARLFVGRREFGGSELPYSGEIAGFVISAGTPDAATIDAWATSLGF